MHKVLKFNLWIVICYLILGFVAIIISYFYSYTIKDTTFVIGIIIFIIELLSITFSDKHSIGVPIEIIGNYQYLLNYYFNRKCSERVNNNIEMDINNFFNPLVMLSSLLLLFTVYFL